MTWKGVIIEESLEDRGILALVRILDKRASFLEEEEQKGKMHLVSIEVEDKNRGKMNEAGKNPLG